VPDPVRSETAKNCVRTRAPGASDDAADVTNDITVTSDDTAAKGDEITVTGTVVLDLDFGAGYKYPLLVEKATIAKGQ